MSSLNMKYIHIYLYVYTIVYDCINVYTNTHEVFLISCKAGGVQSGERGSRSSPPPPPNGKKKLFLNLAAWFRVYVKLAE